jgi:hypothetical protein
MLVNRDCFNRSKSAKACAATRTTDRFMLYNEEKKKSIVFDRATNDRTRMAMQARARRTRRTPVYARATGSFRSSGRFRADTIAIQ